MPDITINGATIHYTEQGRGLPLVLIHGFPFDGHMWDAQLAALSDRYRVIIPDVPGFGQSRAERPYSIVTLADDLHTLLTQIKALPCVWGGLSMGGYISFAYVTRYPTDLEGLILVDTKCEADDSQAKQNRMKTIETARTAGPKAIADQMLPKLLAPETLHNKPQVVQKLRAMMEASSPDAIEYASLAMRDRRDYGDELPSIPVSTLVLVGDADVLSPPPVATAMCARIPRSEVVLIRNAGHMSPMEQPEQVNAAIRQFLDRLAQR
ncbi:MAG TPA: alpha/beta hydrolase [Tepidisphaeraceae bacterium]|nr:alpha/beta hydrolase [Tepidisphaeraceae bacterium]